MPESVFPKDITCPSCHTRLKINIGIPGIPNAKEVPVIDAMPAVGKFSSAGDEQLINCPNCKGPLLKLVTRKVDP